PLAYNKDMQEDKEGMFDTVKTVKGSLKIFAGMVSTMKVKKEVMATAVKKDFSNATELADYLASKGLPFREAHEVVGKLVLICIERGVFLSDLPLEVLKEASSLFEDDIYEVLLPETAVARRKSAGGTGFEEVRKVLEKIKQTKKS
ncbi:argininosuccinate lyase, partial [Aeromonas veronii]|nr:argininosuccinate lyase [Aeromonas veronii]